MSDFSQLAQQYFDQNIPVVPITPKTKAPIIPNWRRRNFESEIDKYKNFGIGFIPKKCGLIALDLDVENEDIKNKIKKILPNIYCGRIGNPNRLPTMFFKWREGICDFKKKNCPIELIVENFQCVLPPTIHPDFNTPYKWVGQTDLLHADFEMIPDYPDGLLEELLEIVGELPPSTYSTGRHISLIEICGAMVGRDEFEDDIIEELIKYDEENHNPPYFTDKKEPHKGKGKIAAMAMLASVVKTHEQKGYSYNPKEGIEINLSSPEKPKRPPLPHIPGIAQDFFKSIYDYSPISRSRTTLAAVLSILATATGNKLRIGNIYTNLYSLIIIPSGLGKNEPLDYVSELFKSADCDHLINSGVPTSDTAIIQDLNDEGDPPTRLDIVDEADRIFGAIEKSQHNYHQNMSNIYAALYTSSGKHFKGKKAAYAVKKGNEQGVIGSCFSPCISTLMAMTPKDFRDSFTVTTIEKGLGSRFLYFFDDEMKERNFKTTDLNIPNYLTKFIKMWRAKGCKEVAFMNKKPDNTVLSSSVSDLLNDYNNYTFKVAKECGDEGKFRPIHMRQFVNAVKLSLKIASSIQYDTVYPEVTKEAVDCAINLINRLTDEVKNNFAENVSEGKNDYVRNYVLRAISNGANTKKEILSKTRSLDKRTRDNILKELTEANEIVCIQEKRESPGRPVTKYYRQNS